MAQRSHVPKFGNWDSDNVPYTAYFENARKEKASGMRINPNDPEENPEAFMSIRGGPESEGQTRHNATHHRNPSDHGQKSGSRKGIKSESSSDKSNSDYSPLTANHHRLKSDRKKSLVESSNSFSPAIPASGSTRVRNGNHPYDDSHHRAASVPKFGAWDETDPKSGEGFTVIFNKVKEEKHVPSTNFPAVPPQPSNYSPIQHAQGSSSSLSKICCCLFSSTSK